jgi:hypothetical protein
VLRLHKDFVTTTSDYCPMGIDPVISLTDPICPTGTQPPQELHDALDATTTVPAGGQFAWHVNQSTRPFVGGGQVAEQLDDEPYDTQRSGPTSDGCVPFTVTPADADGAVMVTLTIAVEDYDLEVSRVQDGQETLVGSSGNAPGSPKEQVVLSKPAAGDYVAKVVELHRADEPLVAGGGPLQDDAHDGARAHGGLRADVRDAGRDGAGGRRR